MAALTVEATARAAYDVLRGIYDTCTLEISYHWEGRVTTHEDPPYPLLSRLSSASVECVHAALAYWGMHTPTKAALVAFGLISSDWQAYKNFSMPKLGVNVRLDFIKSCFYPIKEKERWSFVRRYHLTAFFYVVALKIWHGVLPMGDLMPTVIEYAVTPATHTWLSQSKETNRKVLERRIEKSITASIICAFGAALFAYTSPQKARMAWQTVKLVPGAVSQAVPYYLDRGLERLHSLVSAAAATSTALPKRTR